MGRMKKLLLLLMAVVLVGCIDHGVGSDLEASTIEGVSITRISHEALLRWDYSAMKSAWKKVTPDGLHGCLYCDVGVKSKAALADHYLKAHGVHLDLLHVDGPGLEISEELPIPGNPSPEPAPKPPR